MPTRFLHRYAGLTEKTFKLGHPRQTADAAAFPLVRGPIRGLALLRTVARHATRATHQVTRLGKVGVVVAIGAKPSSEPAPVRFNSRPTRDGSFIQNKIFQSLIKGPVLVGQPEAHLEELITDDGA